MYAVCPLNHVYAVMSCDLNHMYAMHMSTSDVTIQHHRRGVEYVLNEPSEWRVSGWLLSGWQMSLAVAEFSIEHTICSVFEHGSSLWNRHIQS